MREPHRKGGNESILAPSHAVSFVLRHPRPRMVGEVSRARVGDRRVVRLIEFGRYASERRRKRGGGKPETFDVLGFTHICATSWKRHRRRLGPGS
jgi:hypothetical protein